MAFITVFNSLGTTFSIIDFIQKFRKPPKSWVKMVKYRNRDFHSINFKQLVIKSQVMKLKTSTTILLHFLNNVPKTTTVLKYLTLWFSSEKFDEKRNHNCFVLILDIYEHLKKLLFYLLNGLFISIFANCINMKIISKFHDIILSHV